MGARRADAMPPGFPGKTGPAARDSARRDSAIYRTPLVRRGRLPDPDLPEERVLVRLAAEELAQQLVGVLAAPLGEDDVAVVASGLGIEDPFPREAGEHVGGEHLAPEIAVVARVVPAHHVPEPRGEVRLRILREGHD